MDTKTMAFDVRDIEQFKEFFPDFKSGKMSARELGSKLLEVLHHQAASTATPPSIQVDEEEYNRLKIAYQELQDKNTALEADFKNLQADNQQLQELQQTLQAQLQDLQDNHSTLKAHCKDLQAQLQEAASQQEAYPFTPYFKQLVAVVADKINTLSGTHYTPTDVIMQTVFATYFNSRCAIRYTYPISKAELVALAQEFYPDIANEKDLFEVMIHRVKDETPNYK